MHIRGKYEVSGIKPVVMKTVHRPQCLMMTTTHDGQFMNVDFPAFMLNEQITCKFVFSKFIMR